MTLIPSHISYTDVYSMIQCSTQHEFVVVVFKAQLSWVHYQYHSLLTCHMLFRFPRKTQEENEQDSMNQTLPVMKNCHSCFRRAVTSSLKITT